MVLLFTSAPGHEMQIGASVSSSVSIPQASKSPCDVVAWPKKGSSLAGACSAPDYASRPAQMTQARSSTEPCMADGLTLLYRLNRSHCRTAPCEGSHVRVAWREDDWWFLLDVGAEAEPSRYRGSISIDLDPEQTAIPRT